MTTIKSQSPEETKKIATKILDALLADKTKAGTSTIIALKGELGAGKTLFAKGVAEHLKIEKVVTSPTFVIEKLYDIPEGYPWNTLVHIDAYRLEDEEELSAIDWNTIATNPKNLILIEWPEQVGRGVPQRAYTVEFDVIDEQTRNIQIPEQFNIE